MSKRSGAASGGVGRHRPPDHRAAPLCAGVTLDPDHLAAVLQAAAGAGESVTYAEALAALGQRFTRPRMRALCAVLGEVDAGERGAGRPELAVLVVRQSDGLPGQGWWLGHARATGWAGGFTGPAAAAETRRLQTLAFDWWRGQPDDRA